jgi:hypothetical protein
VGLAPLLIDRFGEEFADPLQIAVLAQALLERWMRRSSEGCDPLAQLRQNA